MPVQRTYSLTRAAYSSGHLTIKATVAQDGHPKKGQSFTLEIFSGMKLTTDAKSSALKGNGSWPVTFTPTMAESPNFEISDVPYEERIRFMTFIGDGNGPASTILDLAVTAKLPGIDPDTVTVEGAKFESLADIDLKREGSEAPITGPFTKPKINGIDPLEQRF
jgi:hypothetical protein